MSVICSNRNALPKFLFKFKGTILSSNVSSTAVDNPEWTEILNEAEKVVGYPSSFLNLRWLVNDEVANIALHIRKLIGTNHPILKIARKFLIQNDVPKWGLIVLLFSKTGGYKEKFPEIDKDITAGILHNQRALAEITEMLRVANYLHKTVIKVDPDELNSTDLNFGNKIALLSGDYLLSKCFQELAMIKNHDINEIFSSTIRDFSESEFLGPRDEHNNPIPSKPSKIDEVIIPNEFRTAPFKLAGVMGNAKSEWILRNLMGGATLLAKSCQSTLILAGFPESLQEKGYIFGRNLALAWQASIDIDIFLKSKNNPFSLVAAPIMFHLQAYPEFYLELQSSVDYDKIRKIVANGPGITKTIILRKQLANLALEALKSFDDNDAKSSLLKIVKTLNPD